MQSEEGPPVLLLSVFPLESGSRLWSSPLGEKLFPLIPPSFLIAIEKVEGSLRLFSSRGGDHEGVQEIFDEDVSCFGSKFLPSNVLDDGERVPGARKPAGVRVGVFLKRQGALVTRPLADDQIENNVGIQKQADHLPYL